ncbi:MAG: hypothetical protein AAGD92_01165 [Pseudomonadota bacterium]
MIGRISVMLAALASIAALAVLPARATTLQKFDLADISNRADTIVRGKVMDVEQSVMALGGGQIPYVTYRVKVKEMLKGAPDATKGGVSIVEFSIVGSLKPAGVNDGVQHVDIFEDVPKFQLGKEYVLFMSPESSAGLSSPIGLGQGAFDVFAAGKDEIIVNQFDNKGLGAGIEGPVSWGEFKTAVSAVMNQ